MVLLKWMEPLLVLKQVHSGEALKKRQGEQRKAEKETQLEGQNLLVEVYWEH